MPSANSKQKTLQTPRNHHSLLPHRPLSPLTHSPEHTFSPIFISLSIPPPPMTLVCCTFGLVCPCGCAQHCTSSPPPLCLCCACFFGFVFASVRCTPKNENEQWFVVLCRFGIHNRVKQNNSKGTNSYERERDQLITACWRGNKGNGLRWRTPKQIR